MIQFLVAAIFVGSLFNLFMAIRVYRRVRRLTDRIELRDPVKEDRTFAQFLDDLWNGPR